MMAFNYETQQWVDGPEAALIERGRIIAQLDVLTGPDADRYCHFAGIKDRLWTVEQLKAELARLGAA